MPLGKEDRIVHITVIPPESATPERFPEENKKPDEDSRGDKDGERVRDGEQKAGEAKNTERVEGRMKTREELEDIIRKLRMRIEEQGENRRRRDGIRGLGAGTRYEEEPARPAKEQREERRDTASTPGRGARKRQTSLEEENTRWKRRRGGKRLYRMRREMARDPRKMESPRPEYSQC